MTDEEFNERDYANEGFCIACGAEASGVEPDARNYKCEECYASQVFGIQELLLMGEIMIVDEEDD